ncbi:MAG TPA: DUF456 domain-containing protein [Thermoanaerobaculia bacterium]|nr:DUF456 domain-containing protein [Thermoanaerobaculia bacterium]
MGFLLLTLVLVFSLVLIALGLPGLWVMIASAVVYNITTGTGAIGWFTLVAVTVIAVIAEIIEFTMSARYARKYGGSRRAGWGAMLGGIVGAFVGVPVPIVGPLIGAFVGSFIGALAGELTTGASKTDSARVATGALIGRAVATAMKMGVGCAIAVWLFFAAMS